MLQSGVGILPTLQGSVIDTLLGKPKPSVSQALGFPFASTAAAPAGGTSVLGLLIGLLLLDKPAQQSAASTRGTRPAFQQTSQQPPAFAQSPPARQLNVAVIDQFAPDNSGFNHGEAVANTIRNGGSDSSLSGQVNVLKYNVAGGGNVTDRIANSLDSILQRVQNGEQIDAVNISQQDFSNSGDSQRVRELVQKLTDAGVPVAVAAGNNGPDQSNQLATNSAFTVESDGNSSGSGNIRAQGRTTSFATADLTPILAKLKSEGKSINQIKSQAAANGGRLDVAS